MPSKIGIQLVKIREVNPPVFVWRGIMDITEQGPHCRYCGHYIKGVLIEGKPQKGTPYYNLCWEEVQKYWNDPYWAKIRITSPDKIPPWHPYILLCPTCGWWARGITNWNGEKFKRLKEALMMNFEINSDDLSMEELTSHLSRSFHDVYSLSSRRFEELIASIYRNIRWYVELTKQTRDGGIDIFCIRKSSGEISIIECKRFAEQRKVGIGYVDRLIGAAFRIGASSAHLVTSASFTQPAIAAKVDAIQHGLELNLIDGFELLKAINTFADPSITVNEVERIFQNSPPV